MLARTARSLRLSLRAAPPVAGRGRRLSVGEGQGRSLFEIERQERSVLNDDVLSRLFTALDTNNDGMIQREEYVKGHRYLGFTVREAEDSFDSIVALGMESLTPETFRLVVDDPLARDGIIRGFCRQNTAGPRAAPGDGAPFAEGLAA